MKKSVIALLGLGLTTTVLLSACAPSGPDFEEQGPASIGVDCADLTGLTVESQAVSSGTFASVGFPDLSFVSNSELSVIEGLAKGELIAAVMPFERLAYGVIEEVEALVAIAVLPYGSAANSVPCEAWDFSKPAGDGAEAEQESTNNQPSTESETAAQNNPWLLVTTRDQIVENKAPLTALLAAELSAWESVLANQAEKAGGESSEKAAELKAAELLQLSESELSQLLNQQSVAAFAFSDKQLFDFSLLVDSAKYLPLKLKN